uniref:Uncharacterized protein n=1 Tax=Tetraselmis sp. GSL018 TaxID=582737 RepID=A0A061QN32_9CHLO
MSESLQMACAESFKNLNPSEHWHRTKDSLISVRQAVKVSTTYLLLRAFYLRKLPEI